MPNALSTLIVRRCRAEALARFQRLSERVAAKGFKKSPADATATGRDTRLPCFAEICSHAAHRYNMRVRPSDHGTYSGCLQRVVAEAPWLALVRGVLGDDTRILYSGFLLTDKGCPDQRWHADASVQAEDGSGVRLPITYAVNVYVPLVDLTTEGIGPLELLPKTHSRVHRQATTNEVNGSAASCLAPQAEGQAVRALVKEGTAVLYDFRLLHRGTRNGHGPRPVLYLTYARPWYRGDRAAFSDESVWD